MTMRSVLALAAGVVCITPTLARAQALGLPVVNSGVVTGVALGADVGFANEDAGGKATTFGAKAGVGLGLFDFTAAVSRWKPEQGDAIWSPAAAVTYRLFGGPLVPFRVMIQGGYGRWRSNGVTAMHVPVSLGIAVTIPNPAFAIKPWIAPRYDYIRISAGGASQGDANFALSGGIDLTLLSGISLRAAYDRVFAGSGVKPGILSFGIGFQP